MDRTETKKYQLDTEENRRFLQENVKVLLHFGRDFASPGGSSYYLGEDGIPMKERDRETWITSRMAHVYSMGVLLGDVSSGSRVADALRGLRGELKDQTHGGWYAGVTSEGKPLAGKQCYAHAFVLLAASSAILAGLSDAMDLLTDAMECYRTHFWNEADEMAYDTWDTAFQQLDAYRGLNANMHSVEAFLAVADALGDEDYRRDAGRIIHRVMGFAKENGYRLPEHFSAAWEPQPQMNKETPDDPFKPYGATPGHAIEWARLIVQWASSTYGVHDAQTAPYIQTAEKLYTQAVADAWNVDGARGFVYTTDWEGRPVVHDRMHWTLAEAINTSAVLYRVSGNGRYARDYSEYMCYLDEVVMDHSCGSWFHQLDKHNQPQTSVWPGKPDLYHAVQAMLIPYCPVERSIARALKDAQQKREM